MTNVSPFRRFLAGLLHPRDALADGVSTAVEDMRTAKAKHPLGDIEKPIEPIAGERDPLDSRGRGVGMAPLFGENGTALRATDFPKASDFTKTGYVGDSKVMTADNMVSGSGGLSPAKSGGVVTGVVPESLASWYSSQSWIGFQMCAIFAQHWLIDKACTMPGEDAVRNGYVVNIPEDAVEGGLSTDQAAEYVAKIQDIDNDFNINEELIQFWRNTQIFGIRIAVFAVESDDPEYYSKPFNPDGVTKGSYKGIRQIDPYWMTPSLSGKETSDPTDPHFYDPSYWIIGGKKYHRSHLIIGRGAEVADILKPTYYFGGVSLTQRIYERIYAAERTANEGPLLAITKRTTVLKTNLALAEAQPGRFEARLQRWSLMRDNYGVKTVNTDDNVEQHDTSLADLDKTIMNQYQLVAAISKTPAVKLLGTSPSGFNASGEQETKSYHEHLESVQKFLSPFLRRHHELLARSKFGRDLPVKHTWNRVDSFTALELADLNLKKAQTAAIYTNDVAAVSPDEVRTTLKNDELSGFGHLSDIKAEEAPGATPENMAGETDAQAKETTAGARVEQAQAKTTEAISMEGSTPAQALGELATIIRGLNGEYDPADVVNQLEMILTDLASGMGAPGGLDTGDMTQVRDVVAEIVSILNQAKANTTQDVRGAKPGVKSDITRKAMGHRVSDGSQAGLPDKGGAGYSHRVERTRKFGRYTIRIENPRGSVRSGVDVTTGKAWVTQMPHDYGYIANTVGADGDGVDVFVGPDPDNGKVFVINQVVNGSTDFDEHKVMIGFPSKEAAMRAYDDSFEPGWQGRAGCWECTPSQLAEWIREGDLTLPYRDLWPD